MGTCQEMNLQRNQKVICKRKRKKKTEKGQTKKGKTKDSFIVLNSKTQIDLTDLNCYQKLEKLL